MDKKLTGVMLKHEVHSMTLLPPAAGLCQVCASKHSPEEPHNQQSIYYQMYFQMQHGRGATWADAMAHCSDETKKLITQFLTERGEKID